MTLLSKDATDRRQSPGLRWFRLLGSHTEEAVFLALAYHVWVGMRDIWMDYVKPAGIRLALHVFTIVWLLSCLGWAVQVLWRL